MPLSVLIIVRRGEDRAQYSIQPLRGTPGLDFLLYPLRRKPGLSFRLRPQRIRPHFQPFSSLRKWFIASKQTYVCLSR